MKIQLKRSNVLDGGSAKEPTATQMEYGEIAVNYNEQDPVLFIKDRTNQIIRIAGAGSSGSFSGDYNDLSNKPIIGDGIIRINNADGSENAQFSVNQETPTTVTLPAGFSGDYNDLTNKPGLQEVTDAGSTTTNGATFGGDVNISELDISADEASGHSITTNGRLTCQISTSRSANFTVYEAYRGSELKTKLTNAAILTLGRRLQSDADKAENIILQGTDGAATFVKSVTTAEFNPGADGAGNFRIDLLPNISTAPK